MVSSCHLGQTLGGMQAGYKCAAAGVLSDGSARRFSVCHSSLPHTGDGVGAIRDDLLRAGLSAQSGRLSVLLRSVFGKVPQTVVRESLVAAPTVKAIACRGNAVSMSRC